MGLTMSDYEAQANKFLADYGMSFKAAYQGTKCPMWCDGCKHGDHYRITIKRDRLSRSISFDFWNSQHAAQEGRAPTAYDVLACISGDYGTPGTFDEYCATYGFDLDSRKAEQAYKLTDRFARKLRAFFTEDEARALSEIQ